VVQAPFSLTGGPNSYHGLSAGIVGPSPAKKKLSLGDYMSRISNLATTPTIEKSHSQALESTPTAALQQDQPTKIFPIAEEIGAPPSAMLKPSESFKQACGPAEGSAIADTPVKDESGAETLIRTVSAPQLGPILSNSPVPPTRPLANTTGVIMPDVASVLSQLSAIVSVKGPHRSHSASSS